MDARRFDSFVASFPALDTRRGLLRRLPALLLIGLAIAWTATDDAVGHRKKRKHKHKHKRKQCRPEPLTTTCAGRCGLATNKCGDPVNCGGCSGTDICCNGACCDGCCGTNGSCGACLAFVTSSEHKGNLGGLGGADEICQNLADNAPTPLPGSYKAWLSIGTGAGESPSTRFRQSGRSYVRVDGETIADSFADLTDGTIDNPIIIMENGEQVPPPSGNVLIWTNTGKDGAETSVSPRDCNHWTSVDPDDLGKLGMSDPIVTDEAWTDLFSVETCDSPGVRLYCFQQD